MKKTILSTLILLTAGMRLQAQTVVPALITSNQTWTKAGNPYIISRNIYIDTGVILKIMPGVKVQSSASYTLTVDGEIRATGNKDTLVEFDKVKFDFTQASTDYDAASGTGNQFSYCSFTGNGSGTTTIALRNTSLLVENAVFTNSYYSIYSTHTGYDSSLIIVRNSSFSGDNYKEGSPLMSSGMYAKWLIENNVFKDARQNYVYGKIIFRENIIKNLKRSYFYITGPSDLSCNRFLNMEQGLYIVTSYTLSTPGRFLFQYNTMDSIGGGFSNYPMIQLSKNSSNTTSKIITQVHHNNFLTVLGTSKKLEILSSNSTPTTSDMVDFQNNYWGTTDTIKLEQYVKDYRDDVMIYGIADYSNYLSSAVKGICLYDSTGCNTAGFRVSVKDTTLTVTSAVIGSRPYMLKWRFGDGSSPVVSKGPLTHKYRLPGRYTICQTVYDSAGNKVCDSICKTVDIQKPGCEASFFAAIDTSDLMSLYIVNTSKGTNQATKFEWDFGDGSGKSGLRKPSHVYSKSGVYLLCLKISDSARNCSSTRCDSVKIGLDGMELFVMEEAQVLRQKSRRSDYSGIVFPNPADQFLTLVLADKSVSNTILKISDLHGKVVKSIKMQKSAGEEKITVPVHDLMSGLYMLEVQGDRPMRIKFIVQH